MITVLVALVGVPRARADNAAEATKLFEEGLALQKEGKHADACVRFAKSYELDRQASRPAPGTQLNLGDCAEREGQLRKAWLLFDDAAREYERRGKAAQATLAKDPASADAKRDAERAAAGGKLAHERADAGDVAVSVRAPGREPYQTLAKAESGKQVIVDVPALRSLSTKDPVKIETHTDAIAGGRDSGRVRVAYVLVGGSAVAVIVGSAFGLKARSKYSDAEKLCNHDGGSLHCPADASADIDSAGKKADISTYSFVGAGLLFAGAAVVYFTAPREHVQIAPTASPSGAGVSLSGRF